MKITSFADVVMYLQHATEAETDAKFLQSDVLTLACEPPTLEKIGMSQKHLLRESATALGRTRRTLFKRLQVGRAFGPAERNERVSWEAHYLCTTTDDPQAWLAVAADQEMTVSQLRAAIKAAGGDPERGERVYLCRAADAQVMGVSQEGVDIVLRLDRELDVTPGMHIIVTMAYEPDVDAVKSTALEETSSTTPH
jgi:type II secretory pathway component HofQ